VEALTLRSTALAADGVQPSKGRTRDHRLLGPHDARDLARAQSSPALLSHRIRFTETSIPIIDDHALPPVDNVVIAANRSPEGLEVCMCVRQFAQGAAHAQESVPANPWCAGTTAVRSAALAISVR
jgi:hypothetical protein